MIRLHSTSPVLLAVLFILSGTAGVAWGEAIPDPARGLYAIWTRPEISDPLPFLKGEQVRLQWREVQPAADRYDFSSLHQQLARIAKLGRFTTVQLNANRHPDFLFGIVPVHQGALKRGETDRMLQYWHPAYVQAYTDLISGVCARGEVVSPPFLPDRGTAQLQRDRDRVSDRPARGARPCPVDRAPRHDARSRLDRGDRR